MGTSHDAFGTQNHVLSTTCMNCHTSSTSPDFNFDKFKPYVDHAHKDSELPPLTSRAPMGNMK
jgi:hypothetical protein